MWWRPFVSGSRDRRCWSVSEWMSVMFVCLRDDRADEGAMLRKVDLVKVGDRPKSACRYTILRYKLPIATLFF